MVRTLVKIGYPGGRSVVDSRLAFVKILTVKRDGVQHNQSDILDIAEQPAPGNREFYYYKFTGAIYFNSDNKFTGFISGRPIFLSLERIFIMYEV